LGRPGRCSGVTGVDQPALEPVGFQQVVDPLPGVAGGLHHHPGHAQLGQPVGHDQQPAGHRLVGGDLLEPPVRPALARDPHTTGQLGLAHVQRRHPLDDLLDLLGLLQHPGPPWAPTSNGRLPAGAAGQQANLIRVLKATVKGPGATPSTRLINGLRRPRTSGVSGQPRRFSPRNGRLPQGGTAAYQVSRAERRAIQRFRRPCSSVSAAGMG
jgi:hypothetical protein